MAASSVSADRRTAFLNAVESAIPAAKGAIDQQVAASEGPVILNFSKKNIGIVSVHALFQAMIRNRYPTVTSLDLSDNQIREISSSVTKMMLTHNPQLRTLSLSGNPLTEAGVRYLATAVSSNTTLMKLDLDETKIGPAGALELARMLVKNVHLLSLELGGNPLKEPGVGHIAVALLTNSTLAKLGLGNTDMTPMDFDIDDLDADNGAGVAFIAEALRSNHSLTSLDLQANSLTNEDGVSLALALTVNTSLQELNLEQHFFTREGAGGALLDALRVNTTLKALNLLEGAEDCFGRLNVDKILMQSNPSLTSFQHERQGYDLSKRNIHNELMRDTPLTSLLLAMLELDGRDDSASWEDLACRSMLADFESLKRCSCSDEKFAQASHQICLQWGNQDPNVKESAVYFNVTKTYGQLLLQELDYRRTSCETEGLPQDNGHYTDHGTHAWSEECFFIQDLPGNARTFAEMRVIAIEQATKATYRSLYPWRGEAHLLHPDFLS